MEIVLLLIMLFIFVLYITFIKENLSLKLKEPNSKKINNIRKKAKEQLLSLLNSDSLKHDLKESYENFNDFYIKLENYEIKRILKLLSIYYKYDKIEKYYYGEINIELSKKGKDVIEFFVKNNIIGLPLNVDFISQVISNLLIFKFKY